MRNTTRNLEERVLTADDARQGEIVLRTRRRRLIFAGGLIGFVLLALLMAVLGY